MILRLLVVGMLLLPAAAPAQPPARDNPPPTGTAIIRGRVVAAATEHGLAKVEVRAVSGPLRVNKAVLTDANGRYEISELPAGHYTVSANKANYVRSAYGERRVFGPGKPIEVANGKIIERIDFALLRTGAITGRVVDELGDAVSDAQIVPMRYSFFNGERRLQSAGPWNATNDLGEYRIHGLMPGSYYVSATARSRSGDSDERLAYAPTFYPGTASAADAQRLVVAPGQTISGVNLTLLPILAARINGIVFDTQGRPLAGAFVNIGPRGGGIPVGVNGTRTKPDGTFTIAGVAPGDYTLWTTTPYVDGEYTSADLTVSGGDISGVQLTAAKPTMIRGRIVFEPGDAKPPSPSAVRITAVRLNQTMSGVPGTTSPKDDGTFELKAAAGRAYVRAPVFGTGDWRLKRVIVNDVDVIDAGLDIPLNATVDGVIVEMTSRHAEISGSVVDAAGDPVRDCFVLAFAQDAARWTPMTRFVSFTRPDLESVFKMRLAAGDYYVVAFEHSEPQPPPTDSDVLVQLRDRAVPLSIADGETKKLELKLSQPPVY
jgi:hypothetical protein